ncbi:hypothetical protein ACWGQ2_00760 [Arthrobacter sp. NPDC055585]
MTLPPNPSSKRALPGGRQLTARRAVVVLGLGLSILFLAGGTLLARLPGNVAFPAADGTPAPLPTADQVPGGIPPQKAQESTGALPPAAAPDPDRPLEVPPGAATRDSGSLPVSRELPEARVLVRLPLPAADAADGHLVADFPQDILPVVPGSLVLSSSVASSGNTLQAGLHASGDPTAVLEFYEGHFQALGFQPGARETAGGTTTAVFSYGSSSVTVTTGEGTPGTAAEYFVFAVLRAGL